MTDSTTAWVDAVLARGLGLKDRLDRGETPDLDAEHAALRRLIAGTPPLAADPAYAGDSEPGGPPFLGLRYALACWVDELIILHTRWDTVWTERKLEESLYGTNDRAWRFWEQASAAFLRPDPGLLGTFVLCAALGFRGDYQNDPVKLAAWLAEAKETAARPPADPPAPPGRAVSADVPPLRGRDEFRQMALSVVSTLLLAGPLVAYLAVRRFGG